MSAPVAITGLGVMSAFGHGVGPFWEGLLAGRGALAPSARAGGALGGTVPPFEARAFVRTPAGRRIDRTSLLALAACRLALADAGLEAEGLDPARTSLVLGTALGNLGETAAFVDRLIARGTANPLVFPNLVLNAPVSYASIELGITGPTAMVTEQEASGEAAIATAVDLVADGVVDRSLCGAADELDTIVYEVLGENGLLAGGVARPFDVAADGPVPGEGAGVVVLEPLAGARARGARVYATIRQHPGFAVASPVHGWPLDARAVARGLAPLLDDTGAVLAGASGSPPRDRLEAEALALALAGRQVAVTAPRGATGDFGAAGALAVAAAALSVAHGVVPPTIGLRSPARGGLDVVTGSARRVAMRRALVPGLARGGACRPIVVEAA
jgi:3-oxoacyl-[acyl-carrier-protein] synthase II